jgi:hypothetical protein
VYDDDDYWDELERIRDLYPDDGGRSNLYELIGTIDSYGLTAILNFTPGPHG